MKLQLHRLRKITFNLFLLLFVLLHSGCSKQEGCTDVTACNYNENADIENGNCEYALDNFDCVGDCLNDIDNDGFCDESEYFIFSLGEGNFQASNSSLWYFDNNENIIEAPNNPLGDIGQSMTVHEDKLYVIMNGSGLIHIYNINVNGIEFDHSYDTQFAGPRNIIIIDNYAFITEWYTNQVRVLDLITEDIVSNISVNGLPEDIIEVNDMLYVSLNMNSDWTSANTVIEINPMSFEITREFTVANNPENFAVINNELFISSTYYDAYWMAHYAMSKIDLNSGNVTIHEDVSGSSFGPDINAVDGKLFRGTSNGALQINLENLTVIENSIVGNFTNIYSMDSFNDKFYFGVSDFSNQNDVIETNLFGEILNTYSVGVIPGSFSFWLND